MTDLLSNFNNALRNILYRNILLNILYLSTVAKRDYIFFLLRQTF